MTQAEERKHPFYCHFTKFLGDNREKRLNNGNLLINLGIFLILISLSVLFFDRDLIWIILIGLSLEMIFLPYWFRGN
tara:strand:+ start:846 stop:1076 length:231 start_codon:yes stop_codon:yes gene_type:complete